MRPYLIIRTDKRQKKKLGLTREEDDEARVRRRIVIPKIVLVTENAIVEKRLQGRFCAFPADLGLQLLNQYWAISGADMAIGLLF